MATTRRRHTIGALRPPTRRGWPSARPCSRWPGATPRPWCSRPTRRTCWASGLHGALSRALRRGRYRRAERDRHRAPGLATTGLHAVRLRLCTVHHRAQYGTGAQRRRLCPSAGSDRRGGQRHLARRLRRHAPCARRPGPDAQPAPHDGDRPGRRRRGLPGDAGDARHRRAGVHPPRRPCRGAAGHRTRAPFRLGQAAQLRPGNDVTVIACGCMVEMAVRASRTLAERGHRRPGIQHAHDQAARPRRDPQAAAETRGIVTAEEHHLTGGLGGAVADFSLWSIQPACAWSACRTTSPWSVPTVPLRAKYGMSAEAIVAACHSLLRAA